MARLTVGQKANRFLKLLLGMQQPVVIEALKGRGFTVQDLVEGWTRLRALTRSRLDHRVTQGTPNPPNRVEQLNTFEDHWFPIARVSLERHFPAAAEFVFGNLPQTHGSEVVLSLQLFLERLTALGSGESPLGEAGIQ